MSSFFGKRLKLSVFGESHGPCVGVVIDGFPSGIVIDEEYINDMMKRRRPGSSTFVTQRKEEDNYEILSGVHMGKTTGSPLCVIIRNKDVRSNDYENVSLVPRPGHADYTAFVKYKGFNDQRGGGHFSGRLTAPIVFAGAVVKKLLNDKGIKILSHISRINDITDDSLDELLYRKDQEESILSNPLPFLNSKKAAEAKEYIEKTQSECDSTGCIIETGIYNFPCGKGSPIYDSVESILSSLVFSIPGVKGIEFGRGFNFACLKGSQSNDPYYNDNGTVKTSSNNMGGILGGISNGMPIIFRAVMKPTPSIFIKQKSIDLNSMEETEISLKGRHDPCIGIRAVPVMEAYAALGIYELLED